MPIMPGRESFDPASFDPALLRSQLVQIWKHCLFENISCLLASKSTQRNEFEQRDGDFLK